MIKKSEKLKFNRFLAWFDMIVKDHGFLRFCYHNFHQVDEKLYRSNMPTPLRIKYYGKLGIKTIINLRGIRKDGGWLLENEACEKHNIKLVDFRARSRAAPEKDMIYKAEKLFKSIKYPALIHCKSGADRVGLASCLYLIGKRNYSTKEASKQLSIKHLHIKYAKTGILDYFFESAIKNRKNSPIEFISWVKNEYNQEELKSRFKSNSLFDVVVDKILKRE